VLGNLWFQKINGTPLLANAPPKIKSERPPAPKRKPDMNWSWENWRDVAPQAYRYAAESLFERTINDFCNKIGTKQTCRGELAMSALRGKADTA
jgi:hypothetical protein